MKTLTEAIQEAVKNIESIEPKSTRHEHILNLLKCAEELSTQFWDEK